MEEMAAVQQNGNYLAPPEQIPTQGFIGLEITETAPHTVKKVS
jgi:hypothetical protein